MSESERRRKYAYNRVLIETGRVLDPQFDPAVVYLSGAHIEMLRNMTQYLNRRDTYMSEQFLGYYLAPTDEDYYSILATVADLEEVLMGNENTIWGYKDRISERVTDSGAAGPLRALALLTCPAGSVYVITLVKMQNDTSITDHQKIQRNDGAGYQVFRDAHDVPAETITIWEGFSVMKEDDILRIVFDGMQANDVLSGQVWGYEMAVP